MLWPCRKNSSDSSWRSRPFSWRFIRHLGSKLDWSQTRNENCFIIDTSVVAKRGKRMERVSYAYDHTQRKGVNGYELVAFGLITPANCYPLCWSIEVFINEAKQRLGLGKEQSRCFAAQVFSTTQTFLRYSILAYLLGREPADVTIDDMFHQIAQEAGTITFCELLRAYFSTVLRSCLETLGRFLHLGPESRKYLDAISTAFKHVTPLQGCEA